MQLHVLLVNVLIDVIDARRVFVCMYVNNKAQGTVIVVGLVYITNSRPLPADTSNRVLRTTNPWVRRC